MKTQKNPNKEKEITKITKVARKESAEALKKRLLANHKQILEDADNILLDDEKAPACYTYIINMKGGDHMIHNLKALDTDPDSQLMTTIKAGARRNLATMFPKQAINRGRDTLVESFTTMRSDIDSDYPALLLVKEEDKNVQFPFSLQKESLVSRVKAKYGSDTRFELGMNEFDEKLIADLEKEEKSNERASKKSGIGNKNRKSKVEAERAL